VTDLDEYLTAIGAGDPEAFARWVAGAEMPLRESLRSFAAVCDTEAALQETLLRVWQLAPTVVPDGRGNSLLRFAHRIARNLCLDEARRKRSEPAPDEEIVPELPDPILRRAIEECRKKLPGKPAQALTARIAAEGAEPDAALARRLGMSLNAFLQNFTRARKLLSDCLRKKQVWT
jgi:RNA polymerase sigma-70 factor (ECF subfamily)